MSYTARIYAGIVLLLVMLSTQGFMYDWFYAEWGGFLPFVFVYIFASNICLTALTALILTLIMGIKDNAR